MKRFPFLYLQDRSKNLADGGTRKLSQFQSTIQSRKGSKTFLYIKKTDKMNPVLTVQSKHQTSGVVVPFGYEIFLWDLSSCKDQQGSPRAWVPALLCCMLILLKINPGVTLLPVGSLSHRYPEATLKGRVIQGLSVAHQSCSLWGVPHPTRLHWLNSSKAQ